jgi:hypothetical protein
VKDDFPGLPPDATKGPTPGTKLTSLGSWNI